MNVKVGPFFDANDEDFVTIQDTYYQSRKPSVELLESVRLRPTLTSFPSPRHGHSPTLPDFAFPRYSYDSISQGDGGTAIDLEQYSPLGMGERGHGTLLAAVCNSVNYFIGIGILGLPYGIKSSGWIGMLYLVILGYLFGVTGHLLGCCQHKLLMNSYPDISEAAFGFMGRILVSFVFYVELLFNMTLLIVLLVDGLITVTNLSWATLFWIVTGSLVLVLNIFTDMRLIGYLSIIGTIATVLLYIVLLISFALKFHDLTMTTHFPVLPSDLETNSTTTALLIRASFRKNNSADHDCIGVWGAFRDSLSRTCIFGDLHGVVASIGVFSGHAILPTVFKSMRRPSKFPTVVMATFSLMGVWYILIGAGGYLVYGESVEGNVLNNFGENFAESTVIIALICVAVVTKFALAAFPIVECMFEVAELEQLHCCTGLDMASHVPVSLGTQFSADSAPTNSGAVFAGAASSSSSSACTSTPSLRSLSVAYLADLERVRAGAGSGSGSQGSANASYSTEGGEGGGASERTALLSRSHQYNPLCGASTLGGTIHPTGGFQSGAFHSAPRQASGDDHSVDSDDYTNIKSVVRKSSEASTRDIGGDDGSTQLTPHHQPKAAGFPSPLERCQSLVDHTATSALNRSLGRSGSHPHTAVHVGDAVNEGAEFGFTDSEVVGPPSAFSRVEKRIGSVTYHVVSDDIDDADRLLLSREYANSPSSDLAARSSFDEFFTHAIDGGGTVGGLGRPESLEGHQSFGDPAASAHMHLCDEYPHPESAIDRTDSSLDESPESTLGAGLAGPRVDPSQSVPPAGPGLGLGLGLGSALGLSRLDIPDSEACRIETARQGLKDFEGLNVALREPTIVMTTTNAAASPAGQSRKRGGRAGRMVRAFSITTAPISNSFCSQERQNFLRKIFRLSVRTLLPVAASGLALAFPNFISLVGIIGGVFGVLISFVIPLLLYWQLFKRELSIFSQGCIVSGLIVGMVCVVGTVIASKN